MLYLKEQIEELIQCDNKCERLSESNTARLLKLLPCGNSICDECLNEFMKLSACPLCSQSHDNLSNLSVNKIYTKILKTKPIALEICQTYEQTRELLDSVKSLLETLTEPQNLFEQKIQTYCEYLSNEIDIEAESKISLIEQYRSDLNKKIEAYKMDRLNSIEKKTEFFTELNEGYMNLAKKFQQRSLSDLNELNKEANDLFTSIKAKSIEIEKCLFGSGKLYFHPNAKQLDVGYLGELNCNPPATSSNLISTIGRRIVNYKLPNHFKQTSIVALSPTHDLIAISVSCQMEMLNGLSAESMKLFLYNKKGRQLTCKDHSWFMDCIGLINDTIVLGHFGLNKIRLNLFDFDLNFKREIVTNAKFNDCCKKEIELNDDEILVKIQQEGRIYASYETRVYVFNEDFVQTDFIRLNLRYSKIKIKKSKIFLLKSSGVIEILCRNTLNSLYEISLNVFKADDVIFDVYADLKIIVVECVAKLVKVYELNGNLLDECKVNFISTISSIQVLSNGDVGIVDKKTGIVYIN